MIDLDNKKQQKRIKLGILANEFFEVSKGRIGGFGWAASRVAQCFNQNPELGVEVVFLAGETYGNPNEADPIIHNTPLILRQKNKLAYTKRIWQDKIDLI